MAERSVGFIQSPDYPSKYSSNTLCSCNLTSESTVSLSMLDVAMTDDADGGCKNDRVTIVANGQRYNHCGMERPSKAQAIAKSINIEFETNNEDVSNGFWLKYQAVEQNTTISISCRSTFKPPPSTTSTTTTTTPAPTTTTIAPTTTTIATTTEQSKDKPTPSLIKSTHKVEFSFNKDFNVDKVKEQSNVKDSIDEDYEYKTNMPSFKMKTPPYPTQRWSSFSHLLPNERSKSSVLPPNIYAKTVMEKIRNTHTNPYTKPSPKFNHELIPKELPGQKYQHIYSNLNPDRHIFSPPRRKPQQPPSNQPSFENYNNPPLPSPLAPPIAPNPHFDRDPNSNEECIYVALPGGMVTVQCKPKSRPPPRQKSRKGMSNLKSKQNNRKAMHENTIKDQSREEDITRTKWHTKSFEEEDKDTEIDDENEDRENVINNETDIIQSEIDENKDEINELELKEELTNEIAEIEDRESNKKSKNYSGQFEQDPITGQNPGENRQESLTVTIIAASVIGSILMIVVLGIIIRFVVNRADPNQQVRRNHKKECVIHKHPQNNMA
ncbi:unnamed protein product [Owenia fusiformis]|uniref:CUB domain-containing protein n=1 Tax=Owenia fusiformis TaxID=6347 RepID=A0A8S4PYQ3_OWEFU|nr:unnamed protein product [Owenia fusiformis]